MSNNIVRAAVVQAGSVIYDTDATLDKAERLAHEAAREGAQLVVFPEVFVGGYPRGHDFGAVMGSRTEAGREAFRRYWEGGVDVPGPAVDRLASLARDAGIHLVTGVLERDGGTLYCTVLFFGPDGTYLGKHRKLMPTAMERLVWGQGDGSTLPVFETVLGKMGAVVCWENYMPLLRYYMYDQGIEIYCAPTADNRPGWSASMQHVAMEGRCFVLACNQFTHVKDFPEDHPRRETDTDDTILSAGGSCIVSPSGEFLAEPDFSGEGILYADLDMGEIPKWKFDFDVVGHYSRPDMFRLSVDTEEKVTTTTSHPPAPTRVGAPADLPDVVGGNDGE